MCVCCNMLQISPMIPSKVHTGVGPRLLIPAHQKCGLKYDALVLSKISHSSLCSRNIDGSPTD